MLVMECPFSFGANMGYRMTVMPKTGVKEFNKEREKKTKQMPLLSGVWCLLLSSTLRVVLVFFPSVAGTF